MLYYVLRYSNIHEEGLVNKCGEDPRAFA